MNRKQIVECANAEMIENVRNEVYIYCANKGTTPKPHCLEAITSLCFEYDFIDSRIDNLIE